MSAWSWIGQYHAMKPPLYVINLKYGVIICKKFDNFVKDSTMCPIVCDSFHGMSYFFYIGNQMKFKFDVSSSFPACRVAQEI